MCLLVQIDVIYSADVAVLPLKSPPSRAGQHFERLRTHFDSFGFTFDLSGVKKLRTA
jgi:hypothetical protein